MPGSNPSSRCCSITRHSDPVGEDILNSVETGSVRSYITFYVNGAKYVVDNPDPEMMLLEYIRDVRGLTGTKKGCGEGGCGACSIAVSKWDPLENRVVTRALASCMFPLPLVDGCSVTTVEGVGSKAGGVHAIQESIAHSHGTQCGYCSPGYVVSLFALTEGAPADQPPNVQEVESALAGHLCRCTGYRPILEAARSFACTTQDIEDTHQVLSACTKNCVTPCEKRKAASRLEDTFPKDLQLQAQANPPLISSGRFATWYSPTSLDALLRLKGIDRKEMWVRGKSMEGLEMLAGKTCLLGGHASDGAELVSGNTDLGYQRIYKNRHSRLMVSLHNVQELRRVEIIEADGNVVIGAGTTINELRELCKYIMDKHPAHETQVFSALYRQTAVFANHMVRNIATVGGTLCASDPLADLIPILIACNATCIAMSSQNGERAIPCSEFALGAHKNALSRDEVLLKVVIPFSTPQQFYRTFKVSKRREDCQATVNAGMFIEFQDSGNKTADPVVTACTIVYGAVSTQQVIASATAQFLLGQPLSNDIISEAVAGVTDEIDINPRLGMTEYRACVVKSLLFKFLTAARTTFSSSPVDPKITSVIDDVNDAHAGIKTAHTGTQSLIERGDKEHPVGLPLPHQSALAHTTGEAKYVGDLPFPINGAHAAFVHSTKAHAKIVSIDCETALRVEGVLGFVSHQDIPGKKILGSLVEDEQIFAIDQVNYHGEPIGLIVAESDDIAQAAALMVQVAYEDLPIIQTIDEAIAADSIWHEWDRSIVRGDFEQAWQASDVVVEGVMRTAPQEHFYIEPQNCIVIPDGDQVTVWAACQNISKIQNAVADVLGVKAKDVTAKVMRIGGAFGGKQDRPMFTTSAAAVAAVKFQRPIKLVLPRASDIMITGMRHGFMGKYKIGATRDGKIQGLSMHVYANGGHSLDLSSCVIDRGLWSAENAYRLGAVHLQGSVCKTNRVSNTAFRGFGVPQCVAVMESAIEHLSRTLKLPGETVRSLNLYQPQDYTPTGDRLQTPTIQRCWDMAKERAEWDKRVEEVARFNASNVYVKRGLAIMPCRSSMGLEADFMNQAGALVQVYPDGTVLVTHGGTEMGQGIHTKMSQIAADCLGIPFAHVRTSETATDKVPNQQPTAGSTGSDFNGWAVKDACDKLLVRLLPVRQELERAANSPDGVSFAEVAYAAYMQKTSLSATGFFKLPDGIYNYDHKRGMTTAYYVWNTSVCEVEVDVLTASWRVVQLDLVQDVGETLNPGIDVGQLEGGFMQGLGLHTMEQPIWARDGHIRTRNVSTLKIPSYDDTPLAMNVHLLPSSGNPVGIYGNKASGEIGVQSGFVVHLAIQDAIHNAWSDPRLTRPSDAGSQHSAVNLPIPSPATVDLILSHLPKAME
eukprot:TRINITY_DN123_c0_g2_i2.p1 TRINITY_DN123_c0_g2~~TRINITY_DN123_c0_g2_i2.p1  ORF type:complete len:1383 (+),score=290.83 TRINITY_DN123_c0_g2_i2:369-4517(+)